MFVLLLIFRFLTQVNNNTMSNRVYLPVILSFALLFLIEPSLGLYAINVTLKMYFLVKSELLENSLLDFRQKRWAARA